MSELDRFTCATKIGVAPNGDGTFPNRGQAPQGAGRKGFTLKVAIIPPSRMVEGITLSLLWVCPLTMCEQLRHRRCGRRREGLPAHVGISSEGCMMWLRYLWRRFRCSLWHGRGGTCGECSLRCSTPETQALRDAYMNTSNVHCLRDYTGDGREDCQ